MNNSFKKLLKIVDPEKFRFIVILYENSKQIEEIKSLLKKNFTSYSHDKYDIDIIRSRSKGFIYIDDLDDILTDTKNSSIVNQQRDKIAKSSLNIISFYPKSLETYLHRKATQAIPDFWEFRSPIVSLESEKQNLVNQETSIKDIESSAYSSLGGLNTQSKHIEIERLKKRLLEVQSKELTFNIMKQLARLYNEVGEYENAKVLYEKSLKISENILDDITITTLYNNLASVYMSIGDYYKAKSLFEKALKIREKVLGKNHPETAASYNNLATLYESMGEYQNAEIFSKKALKINENILGELHPNTASSYNNLASIYMSVQEYYKAKSLFEKALKIREKVLGKNHPETAASYNNLATLYESMGEYQNAEIFSKKALKISEKVLGKEHPDTAVIYNNLGALYESMGEYEKAKSLYEKALKIREKVLGKEHPDTAGSYNNLAYFYYNKGNLAEAYIYGKKSFNSLMKVFPENHEKLISIQNLLKIIEIDIKKKSTSITTSKKTGRNEPCPCKSGKKYKKCCGKSSSTS